jgi:hypothetical protein
MSNHIRPWRQKDRKHFKRKIKFAKRKSPKLDPLQVLEDAIRDWKPKIDIP